MLVPRDTYCKQLWYALNQSSKSTWKVIYLLQAHTLHNSTDEFRESVPRSAKYPTYVHYTLRLLTSQAPTSMTWTWRRGSKWVIASLRSSLAFLSQYHNISSVTDILHIELWPGRETDINPANHMTSSQRCDKFHVFRKRYWVNGQNMFLCNK